MNITLGKIVGVFGVKGWVKVFSETRPREDIFKYSPWQLELNGTVLEVKVQEGRAQGKGLVASLDAYTDSDQARELIGSVISIPQAALPDTGIDEYYWSQLIGLQVKNLQGIELGEVIDLIDTGANDVLVVKGDKERLIPYTEFAVIKIDLDGGKLTADWDADF
jgi:16S rRNA processing protein RimM